MNTRILARTLSLFIALLMLVSLVACANVSDDDASKQTSAPTQDTTPAPVGDSSTDTTPEPEVTTFEPSSLDPSLDFNKETITMLHWNDSEFEEFNSEGWSGELINDAIYTRNTTVEDRLNVQLEFMGTAGDTYNEAPFALKLSTSISAGELIYDMVAAYSYTTGLCAAQGLLYDLSDVEHLDFEKPWWPEMLIDQATINNKTFFVSGDISANAILMMYVTFFNKQLLEDHALEDPYALVDKGEWTIDKQFEMSSGVYNDLNGNGKKDAGDRSGLYIYTLHFDSFLWGSDIFIIDSLGDQAHFSDDFMGEKTVNLQARIKDFVFNNDGGLLVTDKNEVYMHFANGLSLFWNDRCERAMVYAGTDLSYGVLPIAKYDQAQDNHITLLGNAFTLYALPSDCQVTEMAGAVMECLACESYRTVSPALFETSFKYKYSQDDTSARMFDIARSSVVFDLARIFSNSVSAYKAWQKAIVGEVAWSTTIKSSERVWNTQLDRVLEIFE